MATLYFSTICIFSLALFVTILDARKVPGDGFGQSVKHERSSVTEAIGDYVINVDLILPLSEKKMDCNTETTKQSIKQKKQSVKEFEPRPNISIYDNEIKLGEEQKSTKDFEPRPNISVYDNEIELNEDKKSIKDFEPRPNISIYDNEIELKEEKKNPNDSFEPRLNISIYNNEIEIVEELKTFSPEDLKQTPSVKSFPGDIGMNEHTSFINDFEERPSATNYHD